MESMPTSFLPTCRLYCFLDMGLGKTIQGVASMSLYHSEWPLLVLCPSGARYHWENEFKQWLGIYAEVNKRDRDGFDKIFPDSRKTTAVTNGGPLLHDRQINVLGSSKSVIFPHGDTKIVICSYGLSSSLIEGGKITKGLFRCAIVDESHMLKNKGTKRTSLLLPILHATRRCILLSGTPALARPIELWPQLSILGIEQHGWGSDEQDFIDKYVKNGNSRRSAELHTMLRGTVMIRRLKDDILKDMPRKIRQKAEINAMRDSQQRLEFLNLMTELRESKGTMGKLARIHQKELDRDSAQMEASSIGEFDHSSADNESGQNAQPMHDPRRARAVDELQIEMNDHLLVGMDRIKNALELQGSQLTPHDRDAMDRQWKEQLRTNIAKAFSERLTQIDAQFGPNGQENVGSAESADNRRSTLLCRLYGLTGDVKVPFIVQSLERWLRDPTKGKICIFAHHISVLNAIQEGVGLSNEGKNARKFIRIDGSTLPRARQDQITAFQSDPTIRVALLGITAAGVAVTLTASSTVWFAELFWTPSIMIQAEGA
jgi:SNF2-related domain/Helicase conserved C-terminal domain